MWKLRLPLKIKFFLWYLKKGVLLTRDNLINRKWKGESKCCFCIKNESIEHLFFDCHVAKFAWNAVFFFFWNTNSYQCYSFVGFLVERSPLETEKTDFGRGGSFVLGALAMPK